MDILSRRYIEGMVGNNVRVQKLLSVSVFEKEPGTAYFLKVSASLWIATSYLLFTLTGMGTGLSSANDKPAPVALQSGLCERSTGERAPHNNVPEEML